MITVRFWWQFCVFLISLTSVNCNSSVRKNCLFSPICLFIQLCVCISMDSWVYLGSNLITLSFMFHLKLFSFGHWELFQVASLVLSNLCLHPFLSTFLPSGTTRYCRLILHFPFPSWMTTSQKTLVPFHGSWYLETIIWVGGVLTVIGMSLLPGLLSRQN